MNNLYTYIAAAKGLPSEIQIAHQSHHDHSYDDQGIRVVSLEAIISFSNGVVLRYTQESDNLLDEIQACPEYWVTYEIISSPDNLAITPTHKQFISLCQEAFCLKMQR